jgi:hypothetical protein
VQRLTIVLALAALALACNPKSLRSGYCNTSSDCKADQTCNPATRKCEAKMDGSAEQSDAADGGPDAMDASDALDATDASDVKPPFHCMGMNDCTDGGPDGAPAVCETEAGACVECLVDNDCAAITRPVCNVSMHTCGPCTTDAQCAAKDTSGPGICMTDGHCPISDEVIFVESVTSGCSNADGSSGQPFCTVAAGVAALRADRNVIVIRGAVGDRLALATTGFSPVVIGRKSSANEDASIPATNTTAITVTSDTVLIRDLIVNAGTSSTASKGVVVSGAIAKLTLSNVQVNLTTGLGIQADLGAQLTMDRCAVTNNSVGGLLINGAGFDIQNSAFFGNGYGVKFSATPPPRSSQFRFVTIAGNSGNALTCDSQNVVNVTDSIVVGFIDTCMALNSITTMPSQLSGYHLTAHLACPMTLVSSAPDHDIDGQPRSAPIDCGADQFVQ